MLYAMVVSRLGKSCVCQEQLQFPILTATKVPDLALSRAAARYSADGKKMLGCCVIRLVVVVFRPVHCGAWQEM